MEKLKGLFKDLIESIGIAIIITFVIVKFIMLPVEVHGSSMEPKLYENQKGLSFVITKNLGVNRFEIVVIDNGEDKLLVKRIIGMPNETIEYKDNVLYINGEVYDEYFLNDNVYTEDLKVTLGNDQYYCLGDNRQVSRDSRSYGAFSYEDFKASHVFIIYPFNEIGLRK